MALSTTVLLSTRPTGHVTRWERTTEGVPVSGQTWTPAPKKGIIPLHPLTFGMLLSKSFVALRHNPKVLFGFGVVIQLAVVVLSATVMGFVFVTTFTRLESLSPSSPDFEAVFAGTIAMN